MVEHTLEEVLSPLAVEDFFRDTWGKNYLFQKGKTFKFRELLPWSAINKILSEHRLDHPRLRLAKDGEGLASSAYLTYQQSRRGVQIPRLRATDLTDLLRDGATLVVDAIDEMHPPLRFLSENLEKTFHEYVQVNAYAGWGATKGFDLHWDDHDVFIMQVEGRKAWKIFGQSRKYPLFQDKAVGVEPPGTVLWEGTLEPGDLLYIPRGWWHVATAVGEPTLHLTFGINNPTGIDLLNWMAEQLVESEVFRKDLPRFSSIEEKANHFDQLREILLGKLSNAVLEDFTHYQDSIARQRPYLSLPYAATAAIVPDDEGLRLRCILPRKTQIVMDSSGTMVNINAIGKVLTFAYTAEPLLKVLLNGQVISLGDLKSAFGEQFSSEELVDLVRALVKEGVLTILE